MNKGKNFLNLISKLITIFSDYHTIKADQELRPKSKMFGVRAIVLCAIGLILIPLFGSLTLRNFELVSRGDLGSIIAIFFMIVLLIIDIYLLGYFIFYPLLCWILQLSLNKKAVGWIGMVLWIVLIGASIVAFAFIPKLF